MSNNMHNCIKRSFKILSYSVLFFYSVFGVSEQQEKDLTELLMLKGELTQGSAVIGQAPKGATLKVNDRVIKTTNSGEFFIGFGRDETLTQSVKLVTATGEEYVDTLKLSKREYNLQQVNGVPQKTVSPSKEHLKRIQQENALVGKARDIVSEHTFFLETFIPPMQSTITGVYGSQRVYNGVPKRPHYGVDYAGPVGAPVYSPASGIVTLVHPDMFFSGGTLVIDHGYGVSSSFLHLSEILVKEGHTINQGDLIAKVGKGGRATGPHLDWRMNWFDVRIDPLKVININKDSAK